MAQDIINSQNVPASFDVFDKKGVAINPLPAGAVVEIVSTDVGIAQWVPDVEGGNIGMITTDTNKIGLVTLNGMVTMPDGTTFTGLVELNVVNSAPNSASFTLGTPVEDEGAEPTEPEPGAPPA